MGARYRALANARARSVAAPIANRERQKSTAGGRKCGQLFSAERAGGRGVASPYGPLQHVGNRSARLARLIELDAPVIVIRSELRMLLEAAEAYRLKNEPTPCS